MKKRSSFRVSLILPIVLALLILALASCGGKGLGYALVLWAQTDGPLHTGEVVSIVKQSQAGKSYQVRSKSSRASVEVPAWRLRVFPSREQALVEASAYEPYLTLYGYAQRDALPLREEPDQEARRIYKLRSGQLVKVISRGSQMVRIADYEDYWYRVLTEDGFEGYCFGYFLPVFSATGDPQAEARSLMAKDPMLDALISTPWRPEYFQEMVESGRIDLTRFSEEIGFFVDREKRQALLVLPGFRQSFDYREISNVGPNRYVLAGPELRVTMMSKDRLVLTYPRKGQQLSQVFLNFTGEINQVVKAESQRRQGLFEEFTRRGPVMASSAYGRIRFQEGMRFAWEGFGRLQDQVFLKRVQGAGMVDFPYFLSKELASRFDGVITFRFSEYGEGELTGFVYNFDASGVRFTFIRPENIQNLEAVRLDISPLVIYFSFGRS